MTTAIDPILPRHRAYGLLDQATGLPSEVTDKIFNQGVEFEQYGGKTANRWYSTTCDNAVVIPENAIKAINDPSLAGPFYPFPVYAFDGCPSSDIDANTSKYYDSSREIATEGASGEFANEIVTGEYSGSKSFTTSAVAVNTTVATVLDAIGKLHRAIAEAKWLTAATFHIPTALTMYFANLIQTRPDGLYFANSNDKVIFDYYPQYTPTKDVLGGGDATAPSDIQTYITVTGEVEKGVGETRQNGVGGEHLKNRFYARAENQGIFRFDTNTVFAALTTYPGLSGESA